MQALAMLRSRNVLGMIFPVGLLFIIASVITRAIFGEADYIFSLIFAPASLSLAAIFAVFLKRKELPAKTFPSQLIASAGVIIVGLDKDGLITVFNETAELVFGYRFNEVSGRSWLELVVPPDESNQVREILNLFNDNGSFPLSSEYCVTTKNGQQRVIFWQHSVVQAPLTAILIGIDVTERRQLEDALVTAKQRAEEANIAKSKFIAAASHDLRQPIHAQGLYLSMLARTELTPTQADILEQLKGMSESSRMMLNALIDFSRIEAGLIKPKAKFFFLQPLLNKLEREFASHVDAKGLAYRSRETNLVVHSDPALIELILRNLILNAVQYTDTGGVLVAARRRGDHAVIEVWDTGIGIEQSLQQTLFQKYQQLGNPEQDGYKGLGLGLAIAARLARLIGQEITLASTPQRGSVFRLTLPVSHSELPIQEQFAKPVKQKTGSVRVLLIENDIGMRTYLYQLLTHSGYKCDAAISVEHALEMACAQPPDLLISDYRLNESRNGIEVIAFLRAILGDNVPALLMTGDTSVERTDEAKAHNINLLHKPVLPEDLQRELLIMLKSVN